MPAEVCLAFVWISWSACHRFVWLQGSVSILPKGLVKVSELTCWPLPRFWSWFSRSWPRQDPVSQPKRNNEIIAACKHLRICSPVTELVHTSQYQFMNPSRDDDIVYIIQYIENNLRLINCYARSFRLFKADPDTRVGDPIHLTSPHPPVSPSATTAKHLSCYYYLRLRHSRLTI
jgi:hypothetical protein